MDSGRFPIFRRAAVATRGLLKFHRFPYAAPNALPGADQSRGVSHWNSPKREKGTELKLEKIFFWAKRILVFHGLYLVVIIPGSWLYERLSMGDMVAFASQICERDVFGPDDFDELRYLGVNISALTPVVGARVRFSEVFVVAVWGMYSDGLSDTEIQEFVSKLPTGEVPGEFLTPPLPDLHAETTTTLMMRGILQPGKHCREPFVTVTASHGGVYHQNPSFASVREFPLLHLSPAVSVLVAYLVPLVIFLLFLLVRRAGTYFSKFPKNSRS